MSLESQYSATENYTVVESSAGEWMSFAQSFGHGTNTIEEGSFQSCSFAPDGGPSASCVEVDRDVMGIGPTTTVLETFSSTIEGSKVPVTVFAAPTSSSNAGRSWANLQMNTYYILFLFGMVLFVG
ncbi:hypothetical protein BDP27DRAFT_1443013 [Rhodocollybia butyracea]|uniref:Uncharacterized protein n=1 Tax=Rhodocollybia butyracea TaxID=206335 RepID=A0A9P5Q6V1_9AGAR|nr:hypothetical protein BDP27DRAFT_1443013 [Rhodocollybia butyracea]